VTFFNVIATPGLGKKNDILKQEETLYGQAEVSINANPLNGNLFVQDFTKKIIEQGFHCDIGYRYNSQSQCPWSLNQGKIIGSIQGSPNKLNSFVVVEESDGHKNTYTYDPERGSYVNQSEAGGASVLNYTREGKWIGWNPATNIRESYNKTNQLEAITDSSGNQLTYKYDKKGRLISISGSSGPKVLIEYNAQTTTVYSIDGDKKTPMMKYLFDKKNQLKQTTIPVNAHEDYEINYSYSERSGLLERITQSDHTEVSFGYEQQDDTYYLNSVKNGAENEFRLSYKHKSTRLIDPLGDVETFTQNESGLLEKHTCHEQYQEYAYDALGRVDSIHYQDESAKQFRYDALGCCSELTGRTGEQTLYRRDVKTGLVLCETQILSSVEPARHLNTFSIYNDKSELIFKVMPHGAVHAYEHDKQGNCKSEKVFLNAVFDVSHLTKDSTILKSTLEAWCAQKNQAAVALTEWSYNACGQKISQTIYATIDQKGQGVHDEFAAYEEYEWTNFGEMLTQKVRLNTKDVAIKSIDYDGLSRPVKEVNALGQATEHTWNENQHQTTFVPTGLVTTESWNKAGLVTHKQEKSLEFSDSSRLIYDDAGRVCSIEKEHGAKEYIVYDEYNRVLYRIDSLMRVTKNAYDTNNHLMHQWHYAQPLTQIDEAALKKGSWLPNPRGECCVESTFYNSIGHLVCSINGENGVKEHRYDSLGNRIKTIEYATPLDLKEEHRAALSSPPEFSESPNDKHHNYFYNDAGHLIGEQTPLGQLIAYERTAQGALLKKSTTLDPSSRITHWDPAVVANAAQKTDSFRLDARGHCLEHINAELSATTQRWDAGGRLIEQSCGGETETCDWDALNRLTQKSHSSGLEVTKSYAPCGALASESQTDLIAGTKARSKRIRYNGFGQATHELSLRVAAKLSDPLFANDPVLVELLWQKESVRHTYNSSGLKLSTQDELGNTSYYFYNKAGELCFTVNPTGSITEYTYDGIVHECGSTRYYERCMDEHELASLTGGHLTPELIAFFHNKQSKQDAVERIHFNKRGLIARTIDPEGFETRKKYDAFNNVVELQQ
jgi:YD repeat-containing protein